MKCPLPQQSKAPYWIYIHKAVKLMWTHMKLHKAPRIRALRALWLLFTNRVRVHPSLWPLPINRPKKTKNENRPATHLAFSASLPRPFRPPLPRPRRAQMWRPVLPPATRGDSLPLPLLQLRRTRIPRPSPAAAARADRRRRAGDNDDAWGAGRPGAEASSTVRPYLHLRRYQVRTVDDAQVPRGEQE